MLRSIFVSPKTTPLTDFGKFYRVTKDLEAPYSPFFYGSLDNATYMSMVDSIGKVPTGVKVLRRIIDHIAAFKHRPSNELADLVVTQCIDGLWPRTLLAFLDYLKTEEIPVNTEIWGNSIRFVKDLNGYSAYAVELVDMAIQSKASLEWKLVNSLAEKLLSQQNTDEISNFYLKIKEAIPEAIKVEDAKERETQILKQQTKLFADFLQFWLNNDCFETAIDLLEVHTENEGFLSEAIYEIAFSIVSRTGSASKFKLYYSTFKANVDLKINTRIIASMLKAAISIGVEGTRVIYELQELMMAEDCALYSAYSANLLLKALGKIEDWAGIEKLMSTVLSKGLTMNASTKAILESCLNSCFDLQHKTQLRELYSRVRIAP
jgi:hypothetical protein